MTVPWADWCQMLAILQSGCSELSEWKGRGSGERRSRR